MFFLNPINACITTGIWATKFLYLCFRVDRTSHRDWGSISQAILYRLLRQNTLDLQPRKDNPKFWRSNIIFLAERVDVPALKFCRSVTQDGTGLFMIGTAVVDEGSDTGIDAAKSDTKESAGGAEHVKRWETSKSMELDGPLSEHLAAGQRGIPTAASQLRLGLGSLQAFS